MPLWAEASIPSKSFRVIKLTTPVTASDPSLFTGLPATLVNSGSGNYSVTPAAGPGILSSVAGGTPIPYPSLGLNTANFNCPVATIAAKSNSTQAYLYQPGAAAGTNYGGLPYNTSTQTNAPNQGVCDTSLIGS